MAKTCFVLMGICVVGAAAPQTQSIASLRGRTKADLELALRDYDTLVAEHTQLQEKIDQLCVAGVDGNKEPLAAAESQLAALAQRIKTSQAAIDEIGGQRSCSVSRLFWYTDLGEAKAAAERTGRPILSLRMLGKLTDEFSCANSRFFRAALYSNKEISDYLRDHFVLHWQSVRPVPRVTIDFGDGRKLERTLTGNSAHYVLAANGQPLDVLPGLYGPRAFRDWLASVHELHKKYAAAWLDERGELLRAYHATARDEILRRWDDDIERLGADQANLVLARINVADQSEGAFHSEGVLHVDIRTGKATRRATIAAREDVEESIAKAPLLRFAQFGGQLLEKGMDDELWRALAELHRPNVKLDDASVAVMRKEFPAAVAMRVAVSKMQQEDPVLRMVRTFEDSMTVDTVRNEYLLHRQIHEQFADQNVITTDVDALNEWVYAELFLTPSSDPWLGLAPEDVYTALDNDGRVEPEPGFAIR